MVLIRAVNYWQVDQLAHVFLVISDPRLLADPSVRLTLNALHHLPVYAKNVKTHVQGHAESTHHVTY